MLKKKNFSLQTKSENNFYEHFKRLSNDIAENNAEAVLNFMQSFSNDNEESTFSELDATISRIEIRNSVRKLNTNKSAGNVDLINEYFKNAALF